MRFLISILIFLGSLYLRPAYAQTAFYVSEDVLNQILNELEEIKQRQEELESKLKMEQLKELSIKMDQLMLMLEEIKRELKKIRVRM